MLIMSSSVLPYFPLKRGRVHEVYGPGSFGFFAALMGQTSGTTLWIRENYRLECINPQGLSEFTNPSQLLIANVRHQTDGLASAEEALREKAVTLVMVDISKPLSLTAGRRLQLAAKAGNSTGLCVIPEGMGSHAAETRWYCHPVFQSQDSTQQRWSLIKNKSGTLGSWHVRWNHASRRIDMVSPVSQ
ncbi:ImuA family protein [Phaeobacter sp. C3_T13_0]|uniref:ImuA family protein n=1 Tax=Phaeobacter cretensis TaxID=3342641 RepID=UPI0039BC7600